jgi:HJR/Mrr/RecB family endonuclease
MSHSSIPEDVGGCLLALAVNAALILAFVVFQKIGFWASAGVLLLVVFCFCSVAAMINTLQKFKRCAHGVRRGKDGGCAECKSTELRNVAELRERQEAQARKKSIKPQAEALRTSELRRLRKNWLSKSDHYLQMESRVFEDAVAELFRALGYDVKQTAYSNDRGKDAIAWKDGNKYLIECKRYDVGNTIGRRDLQILVAAMKEENAKGGIYINTGRFTKTAKEYARQENIELYDRRTFPALVNRGFPVEASVTTARVMCCECGAVKEIEIGNAPTVRTCASGHQIINDITTTLIANAHLPQTQVCGLCGSPMRLVRGRHGKFWGCPKFPSCRFTERYRATPAVVRSPD